MARTLPTYLPRIAVLVLVALGATAGLTLAAGSAVPSAPAVPTVSTAPPPPLLVPDVRNQAFVFAKGTLADDGFAWRVAGSVRGYAANVVVSQSPAAGTHVIDTGAPLITLTLKRNSSYTQAGAPSDVSPYAGTAIQVSDLAGNPIGPAAPAKPKKTKAAATPAPATPAATTPAVATPAATTPNVATPTKTTAAAPATPAPKATAKPSSKAAWPATRPPAFTVPGAKKEPLDEMPLPDRAKELCDVARRAQDPFRRRREVLALPERVDRHRSEARMVARRTGAAGFDRGRPPNTVSLGRRCEERVACTAGSRRGQDKGEVLMRSLRNGAPVLARR